MPYRGKRIKSIYAAEIFRLAVDRSYRRMCGSGKAELIKGKKEADSG